MSFEPCDARTLGYIGFACDRPRGHSGFHECSPFPNQIIRWPRWRRTDPVTGSSVTLNDLLAHLNDLAELARHEGFERFADTIRVVRMRVSLMPHVYEQRTRAGSGAGPHVPR